MKIEKDENGEIESVTLYIEEYIHVWFGIAKYKKVTDIEICVGFKIYLPWAQYYVYYKKRKLGVKVIEDAKVKQNL